MAESLITQKAIADSLKELTREKTFDKISVKDISEKCGINRQTFYYHFVDKFDLLEWIYKTELLEPNMAEVDFENWQEKLISTLETMRRDKKFYINTINHTENYIQRFLMEQAGALFQKAIDELDEHTRVDSQQRTFISRFFAYGLCGIIIEWATQDMQEEPEYVAQNMKKLLIYCERAAYIYAPENVIMDDINLK